MEFTPLTVFLYLSILSAVLGLAIALIRSLVFTGNATIEYLNEVDNLIKYAKESMEDDFIDTSEIEEIKRRFSELKTKGQEVKKGGKMVLDNINAIAKYFMKDIPNQLDE